MCEDDGLGAGGAAGDSVRDHGGQRGEHYHPVQHVPQAADGSVRVQEEPVCQYLEAQNVGYNLYMYIYIYIHDEKRRKMHTAKVVSDFQGKKSSCLGRDHDPLCSRAGPRSPVF